jgi:hypothetical protein
MTDEIQSSADRTADTKKLSPPHVDVLLQHPASASVICSDQLVVRDLSITNAADGSELTFSESAVVAQIVTYEGSSSSSLWVFVCVASKECMSDEAVEWRVFAANTVLSIVDAAAIRVDARNESPAEVWALVVSNAGSTPSTTELHKLLGSPLWPLESGPEGAMIADNKPQPSEQPPMQMRPDGILLPSTLALSIGRAVAVIADESSSRLAVINLDYQEDDADDEEEEEEHNDDDADIMDNDD